MNILEAVMAAQGGGAVQNLGRQFGLNDSQVTSALGALVPALSAGLQQNMSSQDGLASLLGALGSGRHAQYMDQGASIGLPGMTQEGNGILGHIFGSKDVSRQVATRASAQTGVSPDILKKMLPLVATLVMGAMSQRAGGAGAALGGGSAGAANLLSMLTPMLDRDRDGSIVDDVMGMMGKMLGGR